MRSGLGCGQAAPVGEDGERDDDVGVRKFGGARGAVLAWLGLGLGLGLGLELGLRLGLGLPLPLPLILTDERDGELEARARHVRLALEQPRVLLGREQTCSGLGLGLGVRRGSGVR